ncbi:MAG: hypothetical protein M5U28_00110 [Sandaracinaceae bacterium]|nr:hypothetical protein [Sandaracinaceae bacterium]
MGVMMYEALAGRLPFEVESVGALFVKIGAGECIPLRIRRPDLEERVCELVHRAFHRDPEQRFESAEALRRELLGLLGGGSTAARAKTISDGARATIGYSEELPAPPRAPAEAGALLEAQEDEDEAPRALSAPPPPPRPSGRAPTWLWAAFGALAVLAIVVPWQLSQEDPRPGPAPGRAAHRAAERPARPDRARGGGRPEPGAAPDAGAPAAPDEAPASRPRGRPDRAAAAGLETNPYRRR